jgi:hypothetical protein
VSCPEASQLRLDIIEWFTMEVFMLHRLTTAAQYDETRRMVIETFNEKMNEVIAEQISKDRQAS